MSQEKPVTPWQGRVELPLPEPEVQSMPLGAVQLSAQEMAAGRPLDDEPDALESGAPQVAEALAPRRLGLLGWGLLGTAALSLLQLLLFVVETLQGSLWLGTLWSGALGLVALGALRLLWQELRQLRQLKQRADWRDQALVLQSSNQPDGARHFCQQLARHTGVAQSAAFAQWQETCQLHHSGAEQLAIYGRTVLAEQDQQARRRISRWSGDAAVLVAISPLASVDMLLILWRSLKMIDEVAACYGIRLGYWSRIRLLRQIARHMLYVGAAELVTDVGLDWLGAELTARLSTRLAQGVGAGLLTARLGLQTMQVCRPIPFAPEDKPRLGQIRTELLSLLADKLGSLLTPAVKHKARVARRDESGT